MTKYNFSILFAALLTCAGSHAQNVVEVSKNLNYRQSVTPQKMDNYLFSTYYSTLIPQHYYKIFFLST